MTDLDAALHALKARTRREILALVWDRELTAGDIAAAFPVTPATISEHLAVLRRAGLVEMTRVGTSRRYRARPAALAELHGILEAATKWRPADDIPERALATASTGPAVTVSVELSTTAEETFAAFVDPQAYSRWLQVPVRIDGDRFAATMEWGTEVRGRYELVSPPSDRHELGLRRPQHPRAGPGADRLPARACIAYRKSRRGPPTGRHPDPSHVHGERLGHGARTAQDEPRPTRVR